MLVMDSLLDILLIICLSETLFELEQEDNKKTLSKINTANTQNDTRFFIFTPH